MCQSPLSIARQPPPHHSTPFVDPLPPSSAPVDQLTSAQPILSTSQRPRIVPIPPSTRSLGSTSSKVLRSPQLLEQIFAFSATNNYTQLEYNSRVVQVDQTYPSRQNTTRPRTPLARVARKPQAVYLATFPAFEDWDELDSSDDEDTLFPETVWTEFERNWYNSAIMRRTKRPSSKPVGRASVERILDKAVMRGLEPNGTKSSLHASLMRVQGSSTYSRLSASSCDRSDSTSPRPRSKSTVSPWAGTVRTPDSQQSASASCTCSKIGRRTEGRGWRELCVCSSGSKGGRACLQPSLSSSA